MKMLLIAYSIFSTSPRSEILPPIPQRGYIPQPRVVAQPRTLGYQPDFKLTLKALYNLGRDAVPL